MTTPKNWRHFAQETWDEIKANDEPYTEQDLRAIDVIAYAFNTIHVATRAEFERLPKETK